MNTQDIMSLADEYASAAVNSHIIWNTQMPHVSADELGTERSRRDRMSIDTRDALQSAIEALQADAARLDYIASNARCDPKMDGNHVWWPTSFNHRLIGPTLRDAIDAAMALDKR